MRSVLMRRSMRELTRHRWRSMLVVVTIAATVTGLWLLAVPSGLDAAVSRRAEEDRLHHLLLSPDNLVYAGPDVAEGAPPPEIMGPEALQALQALPNVAEVEVRPIWWTQMRAGDRVHEIALVGIEDLDDQRVNVVRVEEGAAPSAVWDDLEALIDSVAGGATGVRIGDPIEIMAGDGEFYPFEVSGFGGTVRWASVVAGGRPVVYVPAETVRVFTASSGFNSIEIRLTDAGPEAAQETLRQVRAHLARVAPGLSYRSVPEIRVPGSWEGRENISRMLPLLWVIALVALLSALILVATTTSTLVSQQTAEIGVLKALGGSRRRIMACYLRPVLVLAAAGTAVGCVTGGLMSSAMGQFIQEDLGGIRPTWSLDLRFAAAAIVVGIGGSVLASMPALRRAMAVTVREALGGPGIPDGLSRATRWARSVQWMPGSVRMGLRNTARRRGRSLAAGIQVALGVAVMLGFGAFSITALAVTNETLSNESGDLRVYQAHSLMDEEDAARLSSVPGVASVQPIVYSSAQFGGDDRPAWGLPADTIYRYELSAGRWFSEEEVTSAAPMAVLGAPLAAVTGTRLGDVIDIGTPTGVRAVEVIGIDEALVHDGTYLWLPLETAKAYSGQEHPNVYWVETDTPDPATADRVAADIVATFAAAGDAITVDVHHREMTAAQQEDRVVVAVIQLLGLPIVAIGMIGLVSAMTSTVLERTREIGILRAVGAAARDVRRVFRTEGLALATAGWVMGLPIGYGLAALIVWLFGRALHTSFSLLFPPWLVAAALVGVVVAARLTLRPPLRRAVRMSPSKALRYE